MGRGGGSRRRFESGEIFLSRDSTPSPLSLPTNPKHTRTHQAALKYDSLLVTLISAAGDNSKSSSISSSSSRASLAAAGALARANKSSSVTVLLVDEVAPLPEENAPRLEAIAAALKASGVEDPTAVRFLEKALDAESSHNASVAVGDAADECDADLLILHSDAVHAKRVDANLLAVRIDVFFCYFSLQLERERERERERNSLAFLAHMEKNLKTPKGIRRLPAAAAPLISVLVKKLFIVKERLGERKEEEREGKETTLKNKKTKKIEREYFFFLYSFSLLSHAATPPPLLAAGSSSSLDRIIPERPPPPPVPCPLPEELILPEANALRRASARARTSRPVPR